MNFKIQDLNWFLFLPIRYFIVITNLPIVPMLFYNPL